MGKILIMASAIHGPTRVEIWEVVACGCLGSQVPRGSHPFQVDLFAAALCKPHYRAGSRNGNGTGR